MQTTNEWSWIIIFRMQHAHSDICPAKKKMNKREPKEENKNEQQIQEQEKKNNTYSCTNMHDKSVNIY